MSEFPNIKWTNGRIIIDGVHQNGTELTASWELPDVDTQFMDDVTNAVGKLRKRIETSPPQGGKD